MKSSPTECLLDKLPLTKSLCHGPGCPIHYFFLPLSRGVRPSLDILCGFANNDRDEAIIRAGRPRVPNHPSRARKGGGKYGWKGEGE